MKGQIKTGTYVGNGAAQNIQIGFVPDYVELVNQTDGNSVMIWHNGFAAGTAIGITGSGAATQASNAITAYAGTAGGNSAGFTVGTAASVNGKTYYYVATANQ